MRTFLPIHTEKVGSACYNHVKWTSDDDGTNLVAHFEDGHTRQSVYATVEDLTRAAQTDWRERFREV